MEMEISEEQIKQADVIMGVNRATGDVTIFYGRSLLTLIGAGYEGPNGVPLKVLRVPTDFSDASDEPEQLAAACLAWKGSCDAPAS